MLQTEKPHLLGISSVCVVYFVLFLSVVKDYPVFIACGQASQSLVPVRLSVWQTDGVQGAVPHAMAQAKSRRLALCVREPNV